MNSVRTAWVTAALSAVTVLGWQAVTVHRLWGGNWTALFRVGSRLDVPQEAARGLVRLPDSDGYDGQFYRLIAHDPWFGRGWGRYIDDARLRYRRILVPAAAWALAMGRDRFIDSAFVVCIAVSVLLGVYWTGLWFAQRGCSPAWGAVFMLVPATLTSVDRMLLDGPLCAVFAGFACQVSRGKRPWILLLCAPLVKETGGLMAVAMCLTDVRSRRWKSALVIAATQVPAVAWFAFVHSHTPPSHAVVIVSSPVVGQIDRLLTPRHYPLPRSSELVLQISDAVAIVSLLASAGLGLVFFWRCAGAVEISTVLFILLALSLGGKGHLQEAFGFARPISPFLWTLLAHSIAERRWAAAAIPLGLTASVGLTLGYEAVLVVRGL